MFSCFVQQTTNRSLACCLFQTCCFQHRRQKFAAFTHVLLSKQGCAIEDTSTNVNGVCVFVSFRCLKHKIQGTSHPTFSVVSLCLRCDRLLHFSFNTPLSAQEVTFPSVTQSREELSVGPSTLLCFVVFKLCRW